MFLFAADKGRVAQDICHISYGVYVDDSTSTASATLVLWCQVTYDKADFVLFKGHHKQVILRVFPFFSFAD